MITPLLLSELELPTGHPRAGERCLVYGFVVHHEGGPILVDSGVGSGSAVVDAAYAPLRHPIDQALETAGVGIGDVAMVINTHLHFDHCGNNVRFPGVRLVAQRAELEAAHGPGYTVTEWVDFPGALWSPVDGEAEVAPGVWVIPTPGHTAGHQSVLVAHPDGIDAIAGQAVYDGAEFEAGRSVEPLAASASETTASSVVRLKAAAPDRVFFSHSSRPWRAGAP